MDAETPIKSVVTRIEEAVDAVLRLRTADGGIAALNAGDSSGCWTTAEFLEALGRCGWYGREYVAECRGLVEFLLTTQKTTPRKLVGSWPLVAAGREGSTMATAHAVVGLTAVRKYIASDPAVVARVDESIRLAVAWLLSVQDAATGGWGVEPLGGQSGRVPRMVSTYLALRALGAAGQRVRSSRAAERGVAWTMSMKDPSGGFRPLEGGPSGACSAVRAYIGMRSVDGLPAGDDLRGVITKYIAAHRPESGVWRLETEVYVPEGGAGQTTFNHNGPAEVLEFLAETGSLLDLQVPVVEWFAKEQCPDGTWCLQDTSARHAGIVTWPSVEAIIALGAFVRNLPPTAAVRIEGPEQRAAVRGTETPQGVTRRRRPYLTWALGVICLIQFVLLMNALEWIRHGWEGLPQDFRTAFWWTTIQALVINLIAVGILTSVRRIRRARRRRTRP